MDMSYDAEVDAAYLSLTKIAAGEAVKTVCAVQPPECPGEINLDFDAEGRLLGLEILAASRVLPPGLLPSK